MSQTPTPFELSAGVALGGESLPVIAGPCVIESREFLLGAAQSVATLAEHLGQTIIFKSSYDKANRSSLESFRGPGLKEGLDSLAEVKKATGMAVLTDVHQPSDCEPAAAVCDVLQIPAFLCRQTDLVVAAASTGRPLLIKKGQFMAPDDMLRSVEKARSQGNERVAVTERGTSFGYHNLVVDMRSFTLLQAEGVHVIYDVTHSLQLPGALAKESGGDRRFAEPLTLAAVAAGAAGLYMEIHPCPDEALCDRATQLPPERAESLIEQAQALYRSRSSRPSC